MPIVTPIALALALSGQAAPLDPERLEAFVDGVVTTAMEDHRIPGVVVSVVQHGEILLEKGYGFAREPERVAADPHESLFRIASISKIFNAVALMQLVEQGLVDLDEDFTTYLPDIRFELPRGTVRVRDLLTHSAGFEDGYIGHFWAVDEASDRSLEETVSKYQPAQVRAPGERVVYSNYGTSVVGLIVERLSGKPYAETMQERIFEPLGMANSGFRDWPTPTAQRALARSYTWGNGAFHAPDWAWMHAGWMPAGGITTTAHDMALFMLAQLDADGGGLLTPETVARMRQPLIANHPFVTPNAHGYWANEIWSYPTLQHGGSIFGFMSNMVLVPELGLGIFVSTNAPSGARLSNTLPRRIIGQFHENRLTFPRPNPNAELSEYRGKYRGQRRAYTTLEKANSLVGGITVGSNDQGYLVLNGGAGGRFVPMGRDRFISPDTGERIAFSRDDDGRPVLMHNDYGHNNFERIGFLASTGFAFTIAGLLLLAFVIRIGAFAYHLIRKRDFPEIGVEILARWLTLIVIPVWALFAFALYKDTSAADSLTAVHMAHFPTPWGWTWIIAGLLGALLVVPMLIYLIPMWREGRWPVLYRAAYSAYAAVIIAFTGLLHYWNLLGLRMLG